MSFVLYERLGPVGVITLNRPDRLNAISDALLKNFIAALDEAIEDEQCDVIVLTGAGPAFCAGDDLKEFAAHVGSLERIQAHVAGVQDVTRRMLGSNKPVVAAAHGFAVGGGFEWLLNCDIVVAADDLIAFFPEMQWGLFVTGGITYLLPRVVGYQRAMELLLLGERQSAIRLAELGLVCRVVPKAEALSCAIELARRITEKSRFSVSRLKQALNQDLDSGLWRAVDLEAKITVEAYAQLGTSTRVSRFASRRSDEGRS